MAAALKACDIDFDRLQDARLAWGRERFKEPRPDHFATPAEWK